MQIIDWMVFFMINAILTLILWYYAMKYILKFIRWFVLWFCSDVSPTVVAKGSSLSVKNSFKEGVLIPSKEQAEAIRAQKANYKERYLNKQKTSWRAWSFENKYNDWLYKQKLDEKKIERNNDDMFCADMNRLKQIHERKISRF